MKTKQPKTVELITAIPMQGWIAEVRGKFPFGELQELVGGYVEVVNQPEPIERSAERNEGGKQALELLLNLNNVVPASTGFAPRRSLEYLLSFATPTNRETIERYITTSACRQFIVEHLENLVAFWYRKAAATTEYFQKLGQKPTFEVFIAKANIDCGVRAGEILRIIEDAIKIIN